MEWPDRHSKQTMLYGDRIKPCQGCRRSWAALRHFNARHIVSYKEISCCFTTCPATPLEEPRASPSITKRVIEDIQITAKPLKLAYQIYAVEETHDTFRKSQS